MSEIDNQRRLDRFYIDRLYSMRDKEFEHFKPAWGKVVGIDVMLEDVEKMSKQDQGRIYAKVRKEISLLKSPLHVARLAHAIQHSRSGIGGAAMTNFTCKFCGNKEIWGSTAVPHICNGCATNMAESIAIHYKDSILKREGE